MTQANEHAIGWPPRAIGTVGGAQRPAAHGARAPARPALAAAQVIGSFTGGGAQRLALNLAAGLAAGGARSFAVAVRSAGLQSWEYPGGVEVVELEADRGPPVSVVRAAMRLRRLVREHEIGIVHVHGQATLPFCVTALRGLRPRPRLVFTWHNPDRVLDERGPVRWMNTWAMRRCDRVFGASQEIADLLNARAGVWPPAEVFVNGVGPVETPADPARRRDEPVIVWAARLVRTKNPVILLHAVARLRDEGLRFRVILAGAAPGRTDGYAEQTAELVRELGLEGIVTMPGWVADTAALFRQADIAVQSSRAEGLSLSLLEQMMAGLAIVATDVGDTASAIIDGRTGLLIPPQDETALTDALRRLLLDPELRRRLGRQARELALREFSVERIAERARSEYGALAAGR